VQFVVSSGARYFESCKAQMDLSCLSPSPLRSQQRVRSRSQAESVPQQPPSPQPPPRPVSPKLLASPAKLPAPHCGFSVELPTPGMLSEATATTSRGYGGSQYTVKHWHHLVEQLHTKVYPCNDIIVHIYTPFHPWLTHVLCVVAGARAQVRQ
jgi:hypothetical protein